MKYLQHLSIAAIFLSMIGCGGGGDNGVRVAREGDLELSITDAPTDDAERVEITFEKVVVKPVGGQPKELDDIAVTTLNLLEYTGGESELLINTADGNVDDEPPLPYGDYEWMRLYISDASITIEGQQYELEIPSSDQTGLKLNTPFKIPADGIGFYTIDFDLRHSVIGPFSKKSGEIYYQLKPVLRLVENTGAGKLSGSVASNLLLNCPEAAVYLYEGELEQDELDDIDHLASEDQLSDAGRVNPFMSAFLSDGAGDISFRFGFLPAGDYSIALACGEDNPDVNDEAIEFRSLDNTVNVKISQTTTVELI